MPTLTVIEKDYYTNILQKYCQVHQLSDPDYTVLPTQKGGGFYCTVTVGGRPYTGAIRVDEKEAKESAANFAVQMLTVILSEFHQL